MKRQLFSGEEEKKGEMKKLTQPYLTCEGCLFPFFPFKYNEREKMEREVKFTSKTNTRTSLLDVALATRVTLLLMSKKRPRAVGDERS